MPEEITGEIGNEKEPLNDVSSEEAFQIKSTEQSENLETETVPAEKTEEKYNELLSKVSGNQTQTSTDDAIQLDAKSIGETVDEESKVEKLLQLAETKGVVHAVEVARSLKDYYALDKMHDDLVDKLYNSLLEKGMITEK